MTDEQTAAFDTDILSLVPDAYGKQLGPWCTPETEDE